ncbi:MAG: hypothetical protein JXR56_01310 [Candidatus Cloacimonetes bacterium]|nr:hypothetical protein [Candidatus Cloacimonadota bacterium]
MGWLLLSAFCSIAIANLLKLYQKKDSKSPIIVIFLGNYLFAAIFSFMLVAPLPDRITLKEIVSGFVFGILFITSFLAYQRNIRINGISLSVSIMRLSLLIPVVLAAVFFKESLNLLNYLGIALVLVVFLLMGKQKDRANLYWLLFLFISVGFAESGMKVYKSFSLNSDAFFLLIVFTSATVIALLLCLIQKKRIINKYLLWGIILGIPNQLTALLFMKSLDSIPSIIAYPTLAGGVVIGSIATDTFFWKSRFKRKDFVVLLAILLGVLLINTR